MVEDDRVFYLELRKIQKSLEQCYLHIKSYCCVNIYEDNCCVAVVLEYHIIVSIWKPVAFYYSYKNYINIAERNQHSKVQRIISFNIGSRKGSIMVSQKDFKAPLSLGKGITYSNWKKELRIWEAFTNLKNEKKGPATFLTLNRQAREAALEIPVEELTAETGVNKLLEVLDELYLKDEVSLAYDAYETFEEFIRPASMTINDYIIHFERLHNKAKGYKMEIHDGVLAYRLLNNATISESHKQLIRATLPDLRYTTMKEQLKRVFAKTVTTESVEAQQLKSEFLIKFESDDSSEREDVYFSDKGSRFQKREHSNIGNGSNRYRGKLNNQGF